MLKKEWFSSLLHALHRHGVQGKQWGFLMG
jgi:hypothetical protein